MRARRRFQRARRAPARARRLVGARPRDRPRTRARARGHAAERLAARAARRRTAPCSPTTRRSRSPSNDARQARALFPVLERIAYLNAGTFGPLSRADARRRAAELRADGERGRSGEAVLRAAARAARAGARATGGARRRRAGARRADELDDGRLQHRARRARPRRRGRDRHDERGALRPARARCTPRRGARRRRRADADAILAAVTPRTRLLAISHVLWTTGRAACRSRAARAPACRCSSTARSRSGRSRSTRAGSTSTRSPARSGCAGRTRPARSSSRTRSGCASPAELLLAAAYEPAGAFEPARGRRALRPRLDRAASLAGSRRARLPPEWRFERAAGAGGPLPRAARAARRVVAGDATLVSFRAEAIRRSSSRGSQRPVSSSASSRAAARPRLVRLVDERGRPRAAGRRLVTGCY